MQNWEVLEFLKKAIPHAIAVFLLFCVSAAFYSPSVLSGQRLKQGDTMNYKGMSNETLSYESISGERPAWTDSMFGGMPTAQITGNGFTTLPKVIWLILRFFMSPEVMTLFMAMLSGYILAICLKAPPWIAFIVGATFGLASINILYLSAGHATKVRAISVMPGVVGGLITAFRGNRWAGVGVLTLFLSIHLYANHLQMTYYLMILIIAIGISELIQAGLKGNIKSALITTSFLLVGVFCAILPQSAELALTQSYSHQTTRGENILPLLGSDSDSGLDKDYILEYSMSRGEWLSMIIPDIKGGGDGLYWGEQRFSGGAFYFGAIAFALFLAFLFVGKDPLKWPLIVVTILAIVLSWRDASWLSDFFLNYVPLFNKFRDTKMMLVLVQVCVAVGSTLALKQIWEDAGSGRWKPWVYALGGVAATLFIFYISPTSIFDFSSSIRPDQVLMKYGESNIIQRRLELFNSDVLRSLGLILFAIGSVFAVLKGYFDKKIIIGVLSVFMIGEITLVDNRYPCIWISDFDKEYPFEPSATDFAILETESKNLEGFSQLREAYIDITENDLGHKLTRRHAKATDAASFKALNALTHFRVFDWSNPFNDARTSYFHKSVGGYHGAKLRRYQDFIDRVILPEQKNFASSFESMGIGLALQQLKALPMLNTKYLILPGNDRPLPLTGALGAAWLTSEIKWVDDAESEISAFNEVDISQTAIVDRSFQESLESITISTNPISSVVQLTDYHPEGSTYSTESDSDGLLVLSEIWYPEGWTATIDGEEVPLIRANYILRALPLPAGTHTVELSYNPTDRKMAGLVSGLGSIVLLLFLLLSCFLSKQIN